MNGDKTPPLEDCLIPAMALLACFVVAIMWWLDVGSPPRKGDGVCGNWREWTIEVAASEAPAIVMPNHTAHPLNYQASQMRLALKLIPLPGAYPAISDEYDYPGGGKGVPAVTKESVDKMLADTSQAPLVWLFLRGKDGAKLYDKDHLVIRGLSASRDGYMLCGDNVMQVWQFWRKDTK